MRAELPVTAGSRPDVCAEGLASMKRHRTRPGIASLAPASTSWTAVATGDSCSHRHAALWVLFCCLAQGCKTERVGVCLYCVPGIRGSFYVRATRLQTASSRLPVSGSFWFFSLSFFWPFPQMRQGHTGGRANRWKCRHVGRGRLIHLGAWCYAVLTKRKSEILLHVALEIWV